MSGCDTMQMVGSSLAVARAVRASLEESLGHEFTLWVQPKNWQVVEETRPQGAAGFDLTSLGEALRKQPLGRCSTVIPLQADQHLLTIPVRRKTACPCYWWGWWTPLQHHLAQPGRLPGANADAQKQTGCDGAATRPMHLSNHG